MRVHKTPQQSAYEMSFTDVQQVLRSLLYIKGEMVVTQ
jgi:hypothetical protein